MAKQTSGVRVIGLKELQKALRDADKELPKQLREANKQAAEIVTGKARSNFLGRPGVAPKVAPSVRALAQQRSASVKIGGARFPYALGSEFGGGRHGKGNPTPAGGHTTQFPPFRKSGYALYPAIASESDRVVDAYGDVIDALLGKLAGGVHG